MDVQPQSGQSQSISDDQELAKVLAGVNGEADEVAHATDNQAPEPVKPPTPMPSTPPKPDKSGAPATPTMAEIEQSNEPAVPPTPMPSTPPPAAPAASGADSSLDAIKQQALGELRPLVDKLDASPEEKFDTYLLLIRSTDDKELIAPAHDAAKSIPDEARRAQALLDIIKEIDFLSNPQPEQK